jgi:hypothetical protein
MSNHLNLNKIAPLCSITVYIFAEFNQRNLHLKNLRSLLNDPTGLLNFLLIAPVGPFFLHATCVFEYGLCHPSDIPAGNIVRVCGGARRGHRPSASCARGSIPRLKTGSCVLAAGNGRAASLAPLSFIVHHHHHPFRSFIPCTLLHRDLCYRRITHGLMFFRPECSLIIQKCLTREDHSQPIIPSDWWTCYGFFGKCV